MRISDWSSDVCSSDRQAVAGLRLAVVGCLVGAQELLKSRGPVGVDGRLRKVEVEHAIHVWANSFGGVGQRVSTTGADNDLGIETGGFGLANEQNGSVLIDRKNVV